MSMDALTTAAFESLLREVLPRLHKCLKLEAPKAPEEREPPAELAFLVGEAQELLGLMQAWIRGPELAAEPAPEIEDAGELSEDDALAMLAEEGATEMTGIKLGAGSVADSLSDDRQTDADDDAMDDETRAMLAMAEGEGAAGEEEMDDETRAMLAMAEGEGAAGEEEMDDETRAMLAMAEGGAEAGGSEAGGDMSDDEAMALLEQMDAPATPAAAASDGEMSDDEARALLDAMDAPSAAAAGDEGEMSDDEALALLDAMDAPAAAPKKAAKKAANEDLSADDEAMALLLAMGGQDKSSPEIPAPRATRAPAAAAHAHAEDEHDEDDGEAMGEVEEMAKNDFSADPDMMNDFNNNTDELMETLDQTILQLEQKPDDRETIESIFRAAHTLKGAAGMFGFKAIERVMHRMENLFDLVRKGTLRPDANTIDAVFQGLDVLRTLLQAVKDGKPSGIKTAPIVHALSLAAKGKKAPGRAANAPRAEAAAPAAQAAGASAGGGGGGHEDAPDDGGKGRGQKKTEQQSTIRVDLERLDALVNLVGELVIDRTRFASIEEEIRTTQPQLNVSGNMTETVQLFGRHMNEIHEIIMKIRMVPIGNAFNKFSRIVRDIARQLGKDIELMIDGEDTELDKTLVEQIGDPLIHLIRNSCDHGVEMPDVREAAGKRRTGQIFLSARQEGNHIIITIEDDGKGIPIDIVRRKAIERGMITEDTVLSNRDVFNLIFEPGFSTAEKVTTISGRGVGMDVVRKQISKLKGLIDIDSTQGKGTTTTIRLPLTLAIVQSLLVESHGEIFAIPLSTVIESVRIQPDQIQRVGEAEVIKRHGKVLPLLYLHDTLGLAAKKDVSWYSGYQRHRDPTDPHVASRINRRKERLYVVIVGSGDRRFGLVVDQLLNQQEMVIKSMGPMMKTTPCVAGGAVLGNGEVVLVLDVQELEDHFRSKVRSIAA